MRFESHERLGFTGKLEARRLEEPDPEDLKAFRRGWCLGSKEDLEIRPKTKTTEIGI
jgi:hypothetical protein